MTNLKNIKISVIGGDIRQTILANYLLKKNAIVQCYAIPTDFLDPDILISFDIKSLIAWSDVLIFPVTGTNADGIVRFTSSQIKLDLELLSFAKKGTPIFIGSAVPNISSICEKLDLPIYEIMKNDELAILNSIPSAEGAIALAIDMTPFTIHNSKCAVLGFGRTAITLSRMLYGMGAKVSVIARKAKDRARAFEMSLDSLDFCNLTYAINNFDLIFNTVPEMVLDCKLLSKMKQNSCIIDIASAPGGIDFDAAKRIGIKAILASGLPGKVAPVTSGEMIAKVISDLISNLFK